MHWTIHYYQLFPRHEMMYCRKVNLIFDLIDAATTATIDGNSKFYRAPLHKMYKAK